MRDVGEEGCDFPLGVVHGSNSPKGGIRGHREEKPSAAVEALPWAAARALTRQDPVEESVGHNITNFDFVAALARPGPAVGAAVGVVGAAEAEFAAALAPLAPALLPGSGAQNKADEGEESEEVFHFLG